jgi:hypothetical protein
MRIIEVPLIRLHFPLFSRFSELRLVTELVLRYDRKARWDGNAYGVSCLVIM